MIEAMILVVAVPKKMIMSILC